MWTDSAKDWNGVHIVKREGISMSEGVRQQSDVKNNVKKGVDGSILKYIAILTMLIDHIGAILVMPMAYEQGLDSNVYAIYQLLRNIGRVAFPIFCFFLVEGFYYTRDVKKYALRLFLFALVSEIPFDLALYGQWFSYSSNNVFFTLVLGLLAIWALSYIERFHEFWQEKQWEPILGRILTLSAGLIVIVGFGAFAEMVLFTDYGLGGVVAIAVLYLLRGQKMIAFAGAVLALTVITGDIEILALAMLYPIMQYDGSRGKNMKYVFYAFYPVHLLILALICIGLGV